MWFIGIQMGVIGIFWLSQSTWYHYQNSPTVVSIENNYQEWDTTFPAISICPDSKVEADVNSLEDILVRDPKSFKLAKLNIGEVQSTIRRIANWTYSNSISLDENNEDINPSDYARLFVKTKIAFTYTLNYNEIEELEDFDLQVYMSEHGVCFAYLSKVAQYFNPMEWKIIQYRDRGKPFGSNPFDGDNYFQLTFVDEAGTKVFVHSPEEIPDITGRGDHVEQHSLKTVGVAALSIYSSQETYELSVHQRQCRFLWESNLKISPVYTYNACRMQCRYNLGYKLCGCVPHVYRAVGKEDVCKPEGLACLSKHQDLLMKLRDSSGKRVECKCLPPCNDINYSIDQERSIKWAFGCELRWGIIKYPQIRFKRSILFGFTEVLVAIGGSAGLFLGCSVLSFVEIVYFFTLRLFWYYKNNDSPVK